MTDKFSDPSFSLIERFYCIYIIYAHMHPTPFPFHNIKYSLRIVFKISNGHLFLVTNIVQTFHKTDCKVSP